MIPGHQRHKKRPAIAGLEVEYSETNLRGWRQQRGPSQVFLSVVPGNLPRGLENRSHAVPVEFVLHHPDVAPPAAGDPVQRPVAVEERIDRLPMDVGLLSPRFRIRPHLDRQHSVLYEGRDGDRSS